METFKRNFVNHSLLKRFTIKILVIAIKEVTFGKSRFANRHCQFMVIRYFRLYSARLHKKGNHICNNITNEGRISTRVKSW